MTETSARANIEIQNQLLAEAMRSANVGFLVWDKHRQYIAANEEACEILGTTLTALLGQHVGSHTRDTDADQRINDAIRSDFAYGTAKVNRFDGSGPVNVFYATFTTKSAGTPFMATLLARLPD